MSRNPNVGITAPPKTAPLAFALRGAIAAAPGADQAQAQTNLVESGATMLNQLDAFLNTAWQRFKQTPPWIEDLHANRANYDPNNYLSTATAYPPVGAGITPNSENGLYYETDRTVFYRSVLVANVPTWVYFSGEMYCTQAQLPAGLGTADTGFIANVTDYGHRLRWGGAAWSWAPGDEGSGKMVLFEVDPTGVGWHLYDGTVGVSYLKADGTLGTVTLPNLTSAAANAAYPKAGSPNSGPNAAVAPVFAGAALAAHSHDAPVTDDGTNLITLNVNGTGGSYAARRFVAGSAATIAQNALKTSNTSAGTPAGTIDATAEPRNLVRRPWFRQ